MEPAKIDWKKIESVYEEDRLYETIKAPKWVDFLAPEDDPDYSDDVAWFCRPDCNHPKTAEDFSKFTPASSKHSRSASKTRSPFGDLNQRNARLKRRGQTQSSIPSFDERDLSQDSENQNPNSSTPPNFQIKSMKSLFKSSSERKRPVTEDASEDNVVPTLKPTLSARNLFGGKDILGHISEFCNELKKLTMRSKGKDNGESLKSKENHVVEDKCVVVKEEDHREVLGNLDFKEKQNTPPPQVVKLDKSGGGSGKAIAKEKPRKIKRVDNAENIPVCLNLENVKSQLKDEERLLQIRTNPPSPQCFSAGHASAKTTTTPSKAPKSRLNERSILQEVKQQNKAVVKEEDTQEKSVGGSFAIVDGKESKTALDMFWFLKPCTLSS
ncbi:hypothetical protein LINGRAHAP2_LOCUS30307 [Linum grandiflorum]